MSLVTELLSGTVFVLIGTLLARYLHWVWRATRLTANIPGPACLPIIGSFLEIAVPQHKLLRRYADLTARFGGTFKLWLGPILCVIINNPDDMEVVFTNPHMQKKPLPYRGTQPILGLGLITLSGKDHRRHRKAITPSLHLDILKDFVPVFFANSQRLCERLKPMATSGEVFEVTSHLGWYNSQAVCETVLSTSFPGLEAEKDAFVSSVDRAFKLTMYLAMRPWYLFEPLFALTSRKHKEYKNVVTSLDTFVSKVLKQKLEKIQRGELPPAKRRRALLDHVLASPEAAMITKEELFEELKTIVVTATDTSMEFMSFFLCAMAVRPDLQDKVQQELSDILGDRPLEYSDLPHLEYLDRALKETLRMFPAVPVFGRVAEQDTTLPSGYTLPKGCTVVLSPFFVHRDAHNFPNPFEFDPDRFLPEHTRTRHPFAYVPFSAGARNCIGQRYALLSAKTLAASLLRTYRFLPDMDGPQKIKDFKLSFGASLSFARGAKVRVQARTATPEDAA